MAEPVPIQPDTSFVQERDGVGRRRREKVLPVRHLRLRLLPFHPGNPFPRNQMLAAQWGLKDKLVNDLGPWLCFYCGECSKMCPRQANPGETMMALRRYLTAAVRLDRAVAPDVPLGILGNWRAGARGRRSWWLCSPCRRISDFGLLAHSGAAATATVMLDKFAPKEIVHLAATECWRCS